MGGWQRIQQCLLYLSLPQAFPLSFSICICQLPLAGRHKCTSWCIFEGILVLCTLAHIDNLHPDISSSLIQSQDCPWQFWSIHVYTLHIKEETLKMFCISAELHPQCSGHETDEDSSWTKAFGLIAFTEPGLASSCRPVSYQVLVDTCGFCAHARLENSHSRLYQV